MQTFSAVLWDMDGTLVDTEHYWMEAIAALMGEHGLTWSQEQQLLMVGNDLIDSAKILVAHGLPLDPPVIVEDLLDRVGVLVAEHVPFRPGVQALLAELRAQQIPCMLVTMSYRRLAEAVVAACPEGTFTGIIAGDDVSRGKPDPEPYLTAAAALDLAPGKCLALEDSVPGITSAVAAGTLAIGIPHHVPLADGPGRVLVPTLDGMTVETLGSLARSLTGPHAALLTESPSSHLPEASRRSG